MNEFISTQKAAEAICEYCRGMDGREKTPKIIPDYLQPNSYWHDVIEGWSGGRQFCHASKIFCLATTSVEKSDSLSSSEPTRLDGLERENESLRDRLDASQRELVETYENLVIVRMQDYMELTPPQAAYKLYSLWQDALHKPHEAHPENHEIKALRAVLAKGSPSKEGWISVTQSLPRLDCEHSCLEEEDYGRFSHPVLVFDEDNVAVLRAFRDRDEWIEASTDTILHGITHWQPLPAPPVAPPIEEK
jgi:hypothetical protein